ncbi:hypothetical protein CC86DRAFT_285274 [Ophiobolus disseminans]|uniref:Uncharacterized protein n=1 Tax=Ophiobolus disseminans TaxID=1469910 RepID=A0A6A7A936_9PLEO|nr:hypothetical protein CC86DRAFT_285274 [Ophiobolus disseminans]
MIYTNQPCQVFICADANWGGACEKKFIPLGSSPDVCTVLDGTASSIGPDQGFTCLFYTNAICTTLDSKGSDYIKLTHPGNANVGYTDKGNFNDKLLSVQCVKTAPKGCAGEIC